MSEAQLAERLRELRRLGGVPGDGPSVEAIRSWVAASRSETRVQAQVETILRGEWIVAALALGHALAACDADRSLVRIESPNSNLVLHLNHGRRRLSVECLGGRVGAVVQVVVQFPPPAPAAGRLREALHSALEKDAAHERIPALLAALSLAGDARIRLSIVDATVREARRLEASQKGRWTAAIEQAGLRVLLQAGQWVRYGILTQTQRSGGVAYVAAGGWVRSVDPGEPDGVQIACQPVEGDHVWNVDALRASLAEIRDVDVFSERCWREWLGRDLPPGLESYRDALLLELEPK
jgi:hypothetical protein